MFKTILVPLDGSAESNAALPPARTMAKVLGASILLLRVLPTPALPDDRERGSNALHDLHRIAEELTTAGVQVKSVIRHGNTVDEILDESHSSTVELIIMRTHGRAAVERAVFGSVTEQVLKRSSIPVLLVRPGGRRLTAIRKLLVPVDGSPGGALALGTAVGLAQATGASVKLLEVAVPVPIQTLAAYTYGGMAYYDPAWDEEAFASAQSYVAALVARLRASGLVVDGDVRTAPDVAIAVSAVADQDATDLIVMSTHALTGPARALLGSVADAVVRTAPCPVLLIHRTPEAQRAPTRRSEAVASVGAGAHDR